MEATQTPTTTGTTSTPTIAAPATSAPSTSVTPAERPRTFQEAFARDAAQTTDSQTPAPAAATEQPSATDPTSGNPNTDDKATGEPPQERWPQILDNARAKAKDEALAEWRQQYGWAEQLPRETLQEWTGIAQRMSSDPIGFLNELQAEIANHPTFGPQLRSHAARTLASGRGQQAPEIPTDIEVDLGDGKPINLAQLIRQIAGQQITQEVGPLKQTYEQQQKAQKAAEAHRVLEAKADEVLADITAIVGEEDEAIAAVATTMEKNPSWSAQRAAAHVHKTVLLPKLQGKAQSKVLDDLKTKAAAATVNPAGAVATSTQRPKSFYDKSLSWK